MRGRTDYSLGICHEGFDSRGDQPSLIPTWTVEGAHGVCLRNAKGAI